MTVLRKVHILAGLFCFSQLIVYGIAGLVATFQPSLERPKVPHTVRYEPFHAPASATDREVAEAVYRHLQLPLTRPIPDWFLRRTPEGDLLLDFYNINGIFRVVVLESAAQLRIEHIRNSTWLFLEDIHAATLGDREAPPLVRAWAAWNQAGMWALLLFSASGILLWLAHRPGWVPAWIALATGTLAFTAFWMLLQ
jgi:hypothetical protein